MRGADQAFIDRLVAVFGIDDRAALRAMIAEAGRAYRDANNTLEARQLFTLAHRVGTALANLRGAHELAREMSQAMAPGRPGRRAVAAVQEAPIEEMAARLLPVWEVTDAAAHVPPRTPPGHPPNYPLRALAKVLARYW